MPCAHTGGPAGHLEQLRAKLADRGWITSVLDQGHPSLFVQNPDPGAAALKDHVLVAPNLDGICWFWWPWAQPHRGSRRPDAGRRPHNPRPARHRPPPRELPVTRPNNAAGASGPTVLGHSSSTGVIPRWKPALRAVLS